MTAPSVAQVSAPPYYTYWDIAEEQRERRMLQHPALHDIVLYWPDYVDRDGDVTIVTDDGRVEFVALTALAPLLTSPETLRRTDHYAAAREAHELAVGPFDPAVLADYARRMAYSAALRTERGKTCGACGEFQPAAAYTWNTRGERYSVCRKCKALRERARRALDRAHNGSRASA